MWSSRVLSGWSSACTNPLTTYCTRSWKRADLPRLPLSAPSPFIGGNAAQSLRLLSCGYSSSSPLCSEQHHHRRITAAGLAASGAILSNLLNARWVSFHGFALPRASLSEPQPLAVIMTSLLFASARFKALFGPKGWETERDGGWHHPRGGGLVLRQCRSTYSIILCSVL